MSRPVLPPHRDPSGTRVPPRSWLASGFLYVWASRPQISGSRMAARPLACLAAMMLVDGALIIGDVLLRHGVVADPRYAIALEGGYGELFQYFKALLIAGLLLGLVPRLRGATFWGVVFLVFFADDALGLHESAGVWLADRVRLPVLRATLPEQVGEAVVVSAGVLALAAGAAWIHWRGGGPARMLSAALAPGLLLLLFFGGGIDLVHSMMRDHPVREVLGLIEDGGEMLAMSLLTATVWGYTSVAGQGMRVGGFGSPHG